jgi:hypothetical protein
MLVQKAYTCAIANAASSTATTATFPRASFKIRTAATHLVSSNMAKHDLSYNV